MKYLGKNKILSVILVSSIIASSVILIYILVTPKPGERFTEFYILSLNGKASNYPTNLKIGEEGNVIIGIVNQEHDEVTYRLEVKFNGIIMFEECISISHIESRERLFTFKSTKKGKNQKLEFILYKDKQIEAYRKLQLWVNVI